MSANITSKCSYCGRRSDLCLCEKPQIVCGTCEQPLAQCDCDPGSLYHECEVCFGWQLCEQAGNALQWICAKCLKRGSVQYLLQHGGVL